MLVTSFQLLVFGILFIYGFRKLTRWMHRGGWIQWKMRRGTSSELGNAMLGVQAIFQPPIRDVIEARLQETDDDDASGDPPEPGDDDNAR